jgi:hypothetical protein
MSRFQYGMWFTHPSRSGGAIAFRNRQHPYFIVFSVIASTVVGGPVSIARAADLVV